MSSSYCMPMILCNMGGEMIYILHQRLNAQRINREKSQRVLDDVTKTMFDPSFLKDVFKPQEPYSLQSTIQLFTRIAHCSMMELHSNSMDKLFDLIFMGFKFQVVRIASSFDLIQICFNHINTFRHYIKNPKIIEQINHFEKLIFNLYGGMNLYHLINLRHSLLRFLQNRRIKVSVFRQELLQDDNGHILLSSHGPLPLYFEMPGIIKYYENDSIDCEMKIHLPHNQYLTLPSSSNKNLTTLGMNMYVDRSCLFEGKTPQSQLNKNTSNSIPQNIPTITKQPSATKELDILAKMVGVSDIDSDTFVVDLFFDDDENKEKPFLKKSKSLTYDVHTEDLKSRLAHSFQTLNLIDEEQPKTSMDKSLEQDNDNIDNGDNFLNLLDS